MLLHPLGKTIEHGPHCYNKIPLGNSTPALQLLAKALTSVHTLKTVTLVQLSAKNHELHLQMFSASSIAALVYCGKATFIAHLPVVHAAYLRSSIVDGLSLAMHHWYSVKDHGRLTDCAVGRKVLCVGRVAWLSVQVI